MSLLTRGLGPAPSMITSGLGPPPPAVSDVEKKSRGRRPKDVKEAFDKIRGNIDIYVVTAALLSVNGSPTVLLRVLR